MTSFLHKVISWVYILHVYAEHVSWLANIKPYLYLATKLQEIRIKKLEITVADQGTIAEAKTRHYEDKLKKVTQDAEVKLATAHVEREHAMISFREGIKNSAVVSLLKARIKMAYESKEIGLECPAWPVDSWSGAWESSKAAEVVVEAGEKKDVDADVGQDAAQDASAEEVKKDGGDVAV
ncbi:hypothetical protein Hanom_Chr14g01263661 [Helianthus anomalus]